MDFKIDKYSRDVGINEVEVGWGVAHSSFTCGLYGTGTVTFDEIFDDLLYPMVEKYNTALDGV